MKRRSQVSDSESTKRKICNIAERWAASNTLADERTAKVDEAIAMCVADLAQKNQLKVRFERLLAASEKSMITTLNKDKSKELEGHCKNIRNSLIELQKEITFFEQSRAELEARKTSSDALSYVGDLLSAAKLLVATKEKGHRFAQAELAETVENILAGFEQ